MKSFEAGVAKTEMVLEAVRCLPDGFRMSGGDVVTTHEL